MRLGKRKPILIKYAYQMHFYGPDSYIAFRFRILNLQEHNLICLTALRLSISCATLWRLSICFMFTPSFASVTQQQQHRQISLRPAGKKTRHRIKVFKSAEAELPRDGISRCVLLII